MSWRDWFSAAKWRTVFSRAMAEARPEPTRWRLMLTMGGETMIMGAVFEGTREEASMAARERAIAFGALHTIRTGNMSMGNYHVMPIYEEEAEVRKPVNPFKIGE